MRATPRGYTLIETMMVGLILTLIGGALLVLATTGRTVWLRADALLAVQTQAEKVMNRVVAELRSAREGSVADCNNSILRFTNLEGAPVVYTKTGANVLQRQEGAEAPTAQPNVTQFVCRADPLDPANVRRLTVTATERTLAGQATHTLTTRVWLRHS